MTDHVIKPDENILNKKERNERASSKPSPRLEGLVEDA